MARSKQTSLKREKEKTKQKKRLEKEARKAERLSHSKKGLGLDVLVADVVVSPVRAESKPAEKKETLSSQGRVAYYNDHKGYGFIKDNITKGTVFFDKTSLPTLVKVNDILIYQVVKGPKGATAEQIMKVA